MKQARIEVSLVLLHDLLQLQDDIRVIRCDSTMEDALNQQVSVIIESEYLPDIEEGAKIPLYRMIYQSQFCQSCEKRYIVEANLEKA